MIWGKFWKMLLFKTQVIMGKKILGHVMSMTQSDAGKNHRRHSWFL